MLSQLLRRRLRRATGDDRGITLVELMVAMGLSTILGAITLTVFVSANNSVNATADGLVGSASARNVLQSWASLIQTADAAPVTSSGVATTTCPTGTTSHRFEWLTGTETLFYSDVANRSGSSISCTPPTLIWLGLRAGVLYEVHYTVAVGSSTWSLVDCRILSDSHSATVTAGTLFTPNPGQVLYSVDYGSSFAAGTAFAAMTSCTNAPASMSLASVSDTDATANNSLSQLTSVGIDFTVSDSTGQDSQAYDSTVAVLGGISS
jgi:type II secretory pathway pseudopilin PulG